MTVTVNCYIILIWKGLGFKISIYASTIKSVAGKKLFYIEFQKSSLTNTQANSFKDLNSMIEIYLNCKE